MIFGGHPLGHNILGSVENVRGFKTEDAKRFTSRFYVPENMIFFCYGDVDFKKIVRLLERHTPNTEAKPLQEKKALQEWNREEPPREKVIERNTHQAHVMIGCKAYNVYDNKRMALYLLNNILGGPGMNARLNLALRERYGLVYTVESSMISYGDTGLWAVYFGCDHKDIRKCCRLVRKELDKMMNKPLTEVQLRNAKRQIKGQIALACENHENFAIDFGKSFLHYGWEKDITSLYERIDSITAEDIQDAAKEIFAEERLTTMMYK